MSELIKVHVTESQRALLEHLVTEYLNELILDGTTDLTGLVDLPGLVELKKELQHAGT